jgi:hypothetical protein
VPTALTFQQWFNDLIYRWRQPTYQQIFHEALKVEAWAEPDEDEMRRQWLKRSILRAMKKQRADGLPMAGRGAERGHDGTRFIKRPETWSFADWQFNILLKMKGTKRDIMKAAKVYDFGLLTWPESVKQWPRPEEQPQFYWNLPELDDLEV